MKNPKISVIMLIHDREQYVSQAIESILGQTFRDFEFLIIDNASKDKSINIVQEYQKSDSRIRIYNNDSNNIGAGRNIGLDHAQGDFFTFIDDDDYCEQDYLAFLLNLAETYNADLTVCGSAYEMNQEIRPKYVFEELVLCSREEAVKNYLLRKYFNNANPTKLFRRTKNISKIRYIEKTQYDDIHTMYKYFLAVKEQNIAVAAKGETKYIFRRHGTNNSSAALDFTRLTSAWLKEYLLAYRERTKYISQKLPQLTELAIWSEWSYMISMVEKICRLNITDCLEELRYMRNELKCNKDRFLSAEWTRDYEIEEMNRYVLSE